METNEIRSVTAVIGKETYRTEVQARTHRVVADEPVEDGGRDEGPRPGDFVRMGLATCTAITLRMYANRKNWEVNRIRVTVSNGPFDGKTTYAVGVEVEGSITPEQQERLVQIAKRCPVHKALTHPIEINLDLTVRPLQQLT
jgi:putative redox protein